MKLKTPIRPGEFLKQKLKEMSMSVSELSRRIDISQSRLSGLISNYEYNANGSIYHVKINIKLALKLAETFKVTPKFLLGLQMDYDLYEASKTHKKLKPFKDKK